MRETWISRNVLAGCYQCGGDHYLWDRPNAQGVAARHHDATGHTTWVDVVLHITYGSREGLLGEKSHDPKP